jgi:hypothetical protein
MFPPSERLNDQNNRTEFMKMNELKITLLALMVSGAMVSAEELEVDLTKIPPAATHEVDFEKDVKPLLEASCVKCHSGPRPKHGFDMSTKESFLKGGRSENPGLVVGKSAESLIIQTMSEATEDPDYHMPPEDNRDDYPALKKEQIGIIRAWIDQGAKWPEGMALKAREKE